MPNGHSPLKNHGFSSSDILSGGNDEGKAWALLSILSLFASIGAAYRFFGGSGAGSSDSIDVIGVSVSVFYIGFIVVGYFVLRSRIQLFPPLTNADKIPIVYCAVHVLLISIIYFRTKNPESDIFLFFLLPIVTAIFFLNARVQVAIFVAVLAVLVMTIFACGVVQDHSSARQPFTTDFFIHVVGIRSFGIFVASLAVWLPSDFARKNKEPEGLRMLDSFIAAIPEVLFVKDTQSKFLWASPGFADFVKQTPDEIVGKCDADFFTDELASQYKKDDEKIFSGEVAKLQKEETNQLRKKTDLPIFKPREVFVTKVGVTDKAGEMIGLIGTILDTTVQKEKQRRLFRWFVHDFPKPIDVIRSRVLRDIVDATTDIPVPQKKLIRTSVEKINRLLNFSLACGRAYGFLSGGKGDSWQSGDTPFSCETIIDHVIETLKPTNANIRFTKKVSSGKILSDSEKIMAIAYLLISNAITAINRRVDFPVDEAPNIGVELDLFDNCLELRVVDNGTGIEDGDFDTIFEEGCSRTGSSGFGLYIVREFAKLGGGVAVATVKPPPGAQFNVTITNFTLPNS